MVANSLSSLEAFSSLVAIFLLVMLSISLSVSTKRLPMSEIKKSPYVAMILICNKYIFLAFQNLSESLFMAK